MNNSDASSNYLAVNKESWNARTAYHLKSDFYDLAGFINGKTSLNPLEMELLGDVKGKSILHLQCHFGQDSLSLSRLGAKVTGVDLSDVAVDEAQKLAAKLQLDATFICCDIYDLPLHLTEKFDVVYTTYGVLGWLPDLDRWANLVAQFLKAGGKLILVEFHPVVWMFSNDFSSIEYGYFNRGTIIEHEEATYADNNAKINLEVMTWNHGMAEVINALVTNSLEICGMRELDYSPYDCFNQTVEFEPKKFRIKNLGDKIPMVYSLVAQRMQG